LGSSFRLVTEADFNTLEQQMAETHSLVKDQLKVSKAPEEHLASFVAMAAAQMNSLSEQL